MKRILGIIASVTNNATAAKNVVDALNNSGFTIREDAAEVDSVVNVNKPVNVEWDLTDVDESTPQEFSDKYLNGDLSLAYPFATQIDESTPNCIKALQVDYKHKHEVGIIDVIKLLQLMDDASPFFCSTSLSLDVGGNLELNWKWRSGDDVKKYRETLSPKQVTMQHVQYCINHTKRKMNWS